jgi:ornithine cyclodeaminase
MRIFDLAQIQRAIDITADLETLVSIQKAAFVDFADNLYRVPMPMQFIFPRYCSDCHIKGAYKNNDRHLIIKIANGTPSGSEGIILVFAVDNGQLKAILYDEGWITMLRTAIAGLIVADIIPWRISNIGIIGSGNLAKMLHNLITLRFRDQKVMLYARNSKKAMAITDNICDSVEEVLTKCDVVFTATSSNEPLIKEFDSGTNKAIIALGSDDEHKQEILPELFAKSDMVIVDSKQQAMRFGDVARSIAADIISSDVPVELGKVLTSGMKKDVKSIIADFSGIGAQDVTMTEFILSKLSKNK